MVVVLAIVLSYCMGSISTSTIITRLVAKTDVRQHGSGNAGATNTMRVIGIKWGILVLLLDALKGVVAIWLAHALCGSQVVALCAAGLAVIAGHNWPVFFGFRGGKGIATTIGVLLTIHPVLVPALVAGGVAIILLILTRYVSLASLCFTVLTPIFSGLFSRPATVVTFSAIVAILSIYRHRQNIARLLQGRENRLFSKSS